MSKDKSTPLLGDDERPSFVATWYKLWSLVQNTLPEKLRVPLLEEYIGLSDSGWRAGQRLVKLGEVHKCSPEHVRMIVNQQRDAWLEFEKNASQHKLTREHLRFLQDGFLSSVITDVEALMGSFGWLEAGILMEDAFWDTPSVYNLQRLLELLGFVTVRYNHLLLVGKQGENNPHDLIDKWRNFRQKQKITQMVMKKTVTYLPEAIYDGFRAEAEKKNISLTSLYTESLATALASPPVWSFVAKGAAWQPNPLKKTWSLVGIYVPEELFKKTQRQAELKKISNMHYLACCLVWGARFWLIPELAKTYPIDAAEIEDKENAE